jgi:hypothetical protein
LISRCDSAAIVPNTSELLPEPETPVNTVSRRFGITMLTSLRLFSRPPCTRIKSWLSATCSAGNCVSVLVAMLMVSPSVSRGFLRQTNQRPSGISSRSGSSFTWRRAWMGRGEMRNHSVRRCRRTRVEAGARRKPVTPLLWQGVDLQNLDFAIDHGARHWPPRHRCRG